MKQVGRFLGVVVFFCSACVAAAGAQESRATLTGRVIDADGGVVPGASVTVIADETLVKQQTQTNGQGLWSVGFLNPGPYTITVVAPGFKLSERKGIVLETADNKQIDIALEVGKKSEQVVVYAEAPLIDTTSATSGTVITPEQMTEMPLFSRIPTLLAGLTPGVLLQDPSGNAMMWSVSEASNISADGGVSTNGQDSRSHARNAYQSANHRSNDFLLDGQPNTEGEGGGRINYIPPLDSVAEFRVMKNAYDAQYGRQSGATMNMSFKSGTKNYHGSLYEFNRNNTFNAVYFEDNLTGQPPRPVHYNLYGGTLGGPVRIPKLYNGKEKTFFFLNYEGIRNQDPRGGLKTVPTAKEREGDFSESFSKPPNTECKPVRVYDPWGELHGNDRTEFQQAQTPICSGLPGRNGYGDIIPPDRLSPVATAILKFVPPPNKPSNPGSNASQNLVPGSTRQNKMASFVTRLDHTWNNSHKTYGNVHWNHETEVLDDYFNSVATGGGPNARIAKGIGLDHVWTFGPTKILDLRYSVSRWEEPTQDHGTGFNPTALGFPASFVAQMRVPSFPRITGLFGGTDIGTNNAGSYSKDTYHTGTASITQVRGAMTFHYGGEFRVAQEARGAIGNQGKYDFNNNNWTRSQIQARGPEGSSFASFLLGLPSGGSFPVNADKILSQHYYGFYFQNDWRVKPRLTLNLGLRWDFEGPFTERYNRLTDDFNPTVVNPITPAARAAYAKILSDNSNNPLYQQLAILVPGSSFTVYGAQRFAGVDGQPRGASAGRDYHEFQPRVGFAYRLREHTVMRGGFGRFVPSTSLRGGQNGFSRTTNLNIPNNFRDPRVSDTLDRPFQGGILRPEGTLGPLTNFGQGVDWDNQNPGKPYSWQYSFSIQQEYKGWLFEAGYTHNKTYNLYWTLNRNETGFDVWQYFNAYRPDPTYLAQHPNCLQLNNCRPAQNLLADEKLKNPFQGLAGVNGTLSTNINRNFLDFLRPFKSFGTLDENGNPKGKSQFDALELKAERRFHRGISLLAAFTWSKELDDAAFIGPEVAETVEHSLGGADRPFRFSIAPIYELPVGRGKKFLRNSPGIVNAVLGGWEVSGQWLIQSGTPIEFTYDNHDSNAFTFWDGKNFALPRNRRTLDRWFDTSHFYKKPGQTDDIFGFCSGSHQPTFPAWTGIQNLPGANYDPSRDGNACTSSTGARNGVYQDFGNYVRTMPSRFAVARSSRVNEWNLGVFKNFVIRENLKGQFRFEAFNAFNHPRFGGPNTDPGSSNFGRVTQQQSNAPRQIQFALKLKF